MSNLTKALSVLRPGVNFSNRDNTMANVRWDDPLPGGFTVPTQAEVDAEIARLSAPTDQSDLDNIEKSIKALALVVAQWNGKTIPQLKAAFKTARDSLL